MPYNRQAVYNYAENWALKRNPEYYDFEELGGDCTNFTSQCLYAGSGAMNYTPVTGWYYSSLHNRSASWTSVEYLHKFLVTNEGAGPRGRELPLQYAEIGDVIQLSFDSIQFSHSLIVVRTGFSLAPSNILIACHSYDSFSRPLDTYYYMEHRLIHITN